MTEKLKKDGEDEEEEEEEIEKEDKEEEEENENKEEKEKKKRNENKNVNKEEEEKNEVNIPVQQFDVYGRYKVLEELEYQCYKEYLIDKGDKCRSENRKEILTRYHQEIVKRGYNMTYEQLSNKINNFDKNKTGKEYKKRIEKEFQNENKNTQSNQTTSNTITTQSQNKTQHQIKNDQNAHKQETKEKVQSSCSSDLFSPFLPPENSPLTPSQLPPNSPSSDFESSKIKLPDVFNSNSESSSSDFISFSLYGPNSSSSSSEIPFMSSGSTDIEIQTMDQQQQNPPHFLSSSELFGQNCEKNENSSDKLLQEFKDQSKDQSMSNNNNNNDDKNEVADLINENRHQLNVGHGKHCGKKYYFQPSLYYTSTSLEATSSDTSSEKVLPFENSSANLQPCRDLIESLPMLPIPDQKVEAGSIIMYGELNNLFNSLKRCYKNIHKSYNFYKNKDSNDDPNGPIIFNEKLFEFQKEVENRFYFAISIMARSMKHERVYSRDIFCQCINVKSKKELASSIERIYSGPNSSDSEVYSTESEEEATRTDTNQNMTKESINNSNNNNHNNDGNNIDDDDHLNSIVVNPYMSNIGYLELSKKLASFYQGEFKEELHYSYNIADIESSTVISYKSKLENCTDHLICELAYSKFDNLNRSHVLQLKNIVVETGFYLPITTMHFHHDDAKNTNKLYLCGDIRVKEFTIESLDKIGCKNYQDEIQIWNSNTFYFGEYEYNSSVITVWEDELVLGCGSNVYIWDLNNESNNNDKERATKIKNVKSHFKDYEVDIEKVDLTQGNLCNIHSIQLSNRINQRSFFK